MFFSVGLRGFFSVMLGMQMMPVRRMGVVRGLFMAATAVMFGRLAVVTGSVLVMFGGFVVMFSAFLAHRFCREGVDLGNVTILHRLTGAASELLQFRHGCRIHHGMALPASPGIELVIDGKARQHLQRGVGRLGRDPVSLNG